jgi:predicted RNA-binding Zn-ribbon protein involved in translation (DUF1610 family)
MPNNRKTQEEFENELLEKRNGEYKAIGKYTKLRNKILIRHIKCGYEWEPRADSILNGGSGCPKCSNHKAGFKHGGNSTSITIGLNDLWTTAPEFAKLLNNLSDGYRVGKTSRKSVEWKCPNCGHIQTRKVHSVTHNGLYCEMCNDGFSKPEKFMRSVLLQLGINFQMQKRFKWASNKKYDFYFDEIICEVHGLQHYEHGFQCVGARSLEEEKQNDILKEKLAKENDFTDKTYVVIDARYTDKEWIKNSIINSALSQKYDLSIIDWDKCEKDCLTSIMMQIYDLWNKGYTTSEIKNELNLSKKTTTVSKYLKICNDLGLCNYDPTESKRSSSRHKVVCLNTGEIFNSIVDAENHYNIQNISGCCIGQIKSAGKHPITKEKLKWIYYEDYLKGTDSSEVSA